MLIRLQPGQLDGSSDEEPLEDTTAALSLHSKRTERMQRKRVTREKKRSEKASLTRLPTELVLEILKLLRPSAVFTFSATNRRFRSLVLANSIVIGDDIIQQRYSILTRCFPLPFLLDSVEASIRPLLTDPKRQNQLSIHNKPYPHVLPPDPQRLCTCLTCILTWNNLGLVLDFARWQDNLDKGEPIPTLPRGQKLEWNEELIQRNKRIVVKALESVLWYAQILEIHLDSTVRSIRRHAKNKGNRRVHIDMTEEDAAAGTDHFLNKPGALSLEFPFNRDEYYML
jgi:hypothetical protein